MRVGLGYLTLNRVANTLSGGECQRIKLAPRWVLPWWALCIFSMSPALACTRAIPTRLISVLEILQNLGNTVIVVEHEEEVMRAADQIIDIGPDAGSHGGHLVFQGSLEELMEDGQTHTARYLSGREGIPVPEHRRKWRNGI